MANCQNNMRYGRIRTMQSQQWQNCNCMTTENENRREIKREENCSCQNESGAEPVICKDSLSKMPLAMAYIPWQKWNNIYEICKGFQRGTIFAELDKAFSGRGGCNR